MAKIECELHGDFNQIIREIDAAVMDRSMSASLEDSSDFNFDNGHCAVRVYERYSAFGGNRVSMNVTLIECSGQIKISAITSGGSQAVFFKINTLGEESFLETVEDIIEKFRTGNR